LPSRPHRTLDPSHHPWRRTQRPARRCLPQNASGTVQKVRQRDGLSSLCPITGRHSLFDHGLCPESQISEGQTFMGGSWVPVILIGLPLVVVVIWGIVVYNRLVKARNASKEALRGIDVDLATRFDKLKAAAE